MTARECFGFIIVLSLEFANLSLLLLEHKHLVGIPKFQVVNLSPEFVFDVLFNCCKSRLTEKLQTGLLIV